YPLTGAMNTDVNRFPFGMFARILDGQQIPFFGSYRIRVLNTAGTALQLSPQLVVEANALPMDCQFSDDGDASDDAAEVIGRFAPISVAASGTVVVGGTPAIGDTITVTIGGTAVALTETDDGTGNPLYPTPASI